MPKPFDKPLDVFIEEDVPVRKNALDPKTGRITSIVQMEKQRTMYMDVPKEHYRCKSGEHNFEVTDTHKWIFSCTKCTYSRRVYPTTYKFIDGKLIHKQTGKAI